MKIYISALPLALVVILNIHASSSMWRGETSRTNEIQLAEAEPEPQHQAAPQHQLAPRTHSTRKAGKFRLPKLPDNVALEPVAYYASGGILTSLQYAGIRAEILHFRTVPLELEAIEEGAILIRSVNHSTQGVRYAQKKKGHFRRLEGCCALTNFKASPKPNDFFILHERPYGWYSPEGFQRFELQSLQSSPLRDE